MKRRAWEKLRREVEQLRSRLGSIRASELVALAKRMGRQRFERGKEPTYVRAGWFPLSIPGHPGTLKKGTAHSIVNQLEQDVVAMEAEVEDDEAQADEREEEDDHESE